MKLLYFIPLLSTVGGQERTLTDKANYLVEQGHDVMFVTYEHEGALAYPLDERVQHLDIHCHYFSLYRHPVWYYPIELLRLKRSFRHKMAGVLASFRPDVIIIPIPNTENFLWDMQKVAHHIPIVIESHLSYGHTVIKRGITEKWLYSIEKPVKALGKAQLLIALTAGDARCWHNEGIRQVRVIPNPLTCYPDSLPLAASRLRRIICVGRLTAQKRFDRLIDAFALLAGKYPDWCVDIFGDGEDREKLLQQITDRGLAGRVRLLPPTATIYAAYQRSQFLVLSSDFEGFGLVLIEAMACGLPVVATNCPYGPSDIIEDGKTGLLAKLEVQDLADKMEWMLSHDAERQQMGQRAYEAAARYRQEFVMPQWEHAYHSVIT